MCPYEKFNNSIYSNVNFIIIEIIIYIAGKSNVIKKTLLGK